MAINWRYVRIWMLWAFKASLNRCDVSASDEFFESHVHAVTHPGIVSADNQVDLFGSTGMSRRLGLTGNVGRRSEQQRAT